MLAFLLTGLLALAPQLEVPQADGWVTDLAGMLSASEESSLESLMQSYQSGSGHEIALLTVPTLKGEPLERFALEVGRTWGLGRKGKNDGALLVVAKEERKVRIEAGRGLEGTLTDSISGRIIRDVITPLFRKGEYAQGLRAGIEAMHAAAGGDYGPVERASRHEVGGGLGACFGILIALFFFTIVGRSGRHYRRRGGLGGVLPWILLGQMTSGGRSFGGGHRGGFGGGGLGGGGFGGFGGGGGFSGGGASGGW